MRDRDRKRLRRLRGLRLVDKILGAWLWRNQYGGRIILGLSTIARKNHLSPRDCFASLHVLRAAGVVEFQRRRRGRIL